MLSAVNPGNANLLSRPGFCWRPRCSNFDELPTVTSRTSQPNKHSCLADRVRRLDAFSHGEKMTTNPRT